MRALIRSFEMLIKDNALVQREVMREYDTKVRQTVTSLSRCRLLTTAAVCEPAHSPCPPRRRRHDQRGRNSGHLNRFYPGFVLSFAPVPRPHPTPLTLTLTCSYSTVSGTRPHLSHMHHPNIGSSTSNTTDDTNLTHARTYASNVTSVTQYRIP